MRKQPFDALAERAVIGAIVLDQSQFAIVSRLVNADDFYVPKNKTVYRAIEALVLRGDVVDAISIHSQIKSERTAGQLDSVAYLAELTDDCIPSHAEQYGRIIKELAIRRGIITAGQKIIEEGFNIGIEHNDLIERARNTVLSACESIHTQTAILVKDGVESAIEAATSDYVPNGVIYTGISDIDNFGGLFPQLLTILGARPSMGKSMLALNIATNVALSGKKVLYVSLEDISLFLHFRMLARFANVDSRKIRDRTLNFDEKNRVRNAREIVSCLPLWFDDTGGRTAIDIRRCVLSHADKEGCDLVVIDHLAHVSRQGKEYDALTAAVMQLGEIPKEINAHVLLLSQLNREVEKRGDRMPQLSDLRGTGEIEQRARAVWFLDYPKNYKQDSDPHELRFFCAKNTHGTTGMTNLHVDFSRMYVTNQRFSNQQQNIRESDSYN